MKMNLFLIATALLSVAIVSGSSCNCDFNGDRTIKNRCAGVFCQIDDQCKSNNCTMNFCTDPTDHSLFCSKDPNADCGKCPGLRCNSPQPGMDFYKYQCQYDCVKKSSSLYECGNCTCDRDNHKRNLCLGKFCFNNEECVSGLCHQSYCAEVHTSPETGLQQTVSCTTDPFANCGKCGNVSCQPTEKKGTAECKYTACLSSLGSICSSCECDRNISKVNLCDGVYCDGNYQCASGRCYLGFCARDMHTTDTCVTDSDYACGKCDKVGCKWSYECQNGSCDDTGHCYDTNFWLIILTSTIGLAFLLVLTISIILVKKRNAERRRNALLSEPLNN